MRKSILFISLFAIAFYSNAQLQAPVLSSPADSAVVVRVNTKLIWGASIGGLVFGYEVQVDKDAMFGNPITSFPVNGTAAQTKQLDFNTRYYWRVRAKGSGSTYSAWSATHSFKTFNNEFTSLSPTGANRNPKVSISWDTISGVSTYHYEFADNASFLNATSGSVAHPGNSLIMDQLKFNQAYYFRVWAEHGSDISSKSATATFTTRNDIALLSPDTSATKQHPKTELKCTHTPGVTSYKFQIDDSPAFDQNSLEFQEATVLDGDFKASDPISWFTARLQYQDQYYWRVQAANNTGKSAWSGARSFSTISKVTLTAPLDGSVNVPNKTKLSWVKIAGSENYELQIDTDSTFSDPDIHITNSDTSNIHTLSLTEWVKHYWRVRSYHAKDASAWSDIWSFTVHPVGIDEVNELSFTVSPNPADNMIQLQLYRVEPGDVHVDFYNTLGTLVSSRTISNNSSNVIDVDVSDLNSGAYMMTIEVNNVQSTQRIIIR